MDNNHNDNSINDFDYRLICEYFSSVDRQGPGSDEATLRALSFIPGLTAASHVADLGCGTGSSALLLARTLGCRVTALDLFPDFLDRLRTRADALGLSPRLTTVEASMDSLPFADDAFDAIWSEGAIYNVGFARGLRLWRRHIRPGGFLAVTDATWLTADRPAAIADFWNDAYRSLGYAQLLCRLRLAERSFRHHAVQAFPCDLALAFGPSLADNPGQGQKGIYGIIETIISGVYANCSVPLTRNAVKAFVRSHQIHAFPGPMECLSVRTYRHVRIYVRAHAAYSDSEAEFDRVHSVFNLKRGVDGIEASARADKPLKLIAESNDKSCRKVLIPLAFVYLPKLIAQPALDLCSAFYAARADDIPYQSEIDLSHFSSKDFEIFINNIIT